MSLGKSVIFQECEVIQIHSFFTKICTKSLEVDYY